MSKYNILFQKLKEQKKHAFIPFFVIGDPDYQTSLTVVKKAIDSGADALELGLAFSDPVADGVVIQAADKRALDSSIKVDDAFRFIAEIREYANKITSECLLPIGLLVYCNLVYKRGVEKFYSDAKKAGVDSILIADMPLEESGLVLDAAKNNEIDQIFLVTQTSSNERIKEINKLSFGFIYLVSVLGVTGARTNFSKDVSAFIKRVKENSTLPVCVGFGISNKNQVKEVIDAGADGAIVGSAVVKLIENNLGNKEKMLVDIESFISEMKKEP